MKPEYEQDFPPDNPERRRLHSNDLTYWGNFRQLGTEEVSRVVVEHVEDLAGLSFQVGKPKGEDSRELVNSG
ncbi:MULTISPECIES: hypothetical protein [Kitasatospora]|uniref:hypothetical protein n=1 Tax=Kitasatospora TaxID=2063 RepID=UPI0011D21639|nr:MULTISPECIES: hypothetical protein [Kitasatospora]